MCDYVAPRPSNLNLHFEIQHRNYRWRCTTCEAVFTSRSGADKHRLTTGHRNMANFYARGAQTSLDLPSCIQFLQRGGSIQTAPPAPQPLQIPFMPAPSVSSAGPATTVVGECC